MRGNEMRHERHANTLRVSEANPAQGRGPDGFADKTEEGFVMLVVMLILLVATASAAVAIQATQAELRAAGQERQAVQTRYVAEAGLMTTLSYLDMTANSSDLSALKAQFDFPNPAPVMGVYAEPEYSFNTLTGQGGTRHGALRLTSLSQRAINLSPGDEVSGVITEPQAAGGSGGSGGTGGAAPTTGAAAFIDFYGSLGPGQAYSPYDNDGNSYVADINDCIDVKNASAGNEVQQLSTVVLHCTVTIRARTQVPLNTASPLLRQWNLAGTPFIQNPFTTAHDMRAAVTLPPMMIQ
jgi:hypothetical protein